jgi:hypothetical protein
MRYKFALFTLMVIGLIGCNGEVENSSLDESSQQEMLSEISSETTSSMPSSMISSEAPIVNYIYLNTGGATYWDNDDARFYVYTFNIETMGGWPGTLMSRVGTSAIFSALLTPGFFNVVFARINPLNIEEIWNQTDDLEKPLNSNMFTITDWHAGEFGNSPGTWSTYAG